MEASGQTASTPTGLAQEATSAATPSRTNYLGLQFTALTANDVLGWLKARTAVSPFAYVVTPNVDHMVRLTHASRDVRESYERADLCLCDSRILTRLARMSQVRLPVVPGSDLVLLLFGQVLRSGDSICLIGGSDTVAARIREKFPDYRLIHMDPPMGLRHDPAARKQVATFAIESGARFILLAVGSPQQELIASEIARSSGATGTALCIGAAVDFLSGMKARAPRLVQKAGLEWAWRLASEPRRLWRRYLVDGMRIFPVALRWHRSRNNGGHRG